MVDIRNTSYVNLRVGLNLNMLGYVKYIIKSYGAGDY